MATTNHTSNYNLSQYAPSDPAKYLTNYNQDMAAIDAALKAIKDEADGAVPNTRKIAGLALNADITVAQLIAAGLCPAPESGQWTPTLVGRTTAGTPTYAYQYGSYTRIAKLVYLYFDVKLSSAGGMTGGIEIAGLPYSSNTGCPMFASYLTGVSGLSGHLTVMTGNGTEAGFVSFGANGINWETGNWIQDNTEIRVFGVYSI